MHKIINSTAHGAFLKTVKHPFIKTHWQDALLAFFTLSYIAYFTVASFLRYENFYTGRFDLGNMSQTVWNSLNGNFFMLTDPNGTAEISRLSVHADLILILLAPFYLIWEDPRMLLLIQTLTLSFGGIFVYLISNHLLRNKSISLVFAFAFYLNPAVNWTNLYDFHAVTLATTFLLGGGYFILKRKYFPAIIFLLLAGITKEQIWAINVLFGLYIIFIGKQKILGSLFTIFSVSLFYILFWIAIPLAGEGQHFALSFFKDFGSTPGEVIKNILLNPVHTFQTISHPDKLDYLNKLFQPLGFLSVFALPFLVFALPDLSINLLSSFSPMHQIYYQYSATITPFIFISGVYGVYFIRKLAPNVPIHLFSVLIITMTLVSAYNFGPTLIAKKPNDAMFRKQLPIKAEINFFIKRLPNDNKISASNNLGAHLSHRRFIYVLPKGIDEADRVLILNRENASKKGQETLDALLKNPAFIIEYNIENFYSFRKI